MDALTWLTRHYSIESLISTLIVTAVAVRFLGELFDWLSKKIKAYFDIGDKEEEFKKNIQESLEEIRGQQDNILTQQENLASKIEAERLDVVLLSERIQDSTRAYIIDRFHLFLAQGWIDMMSLEDIERRFMYYKDAGGDTFIDGLMSEMRELPHDPPSPAK